MADAVLPPCISGPNPEPIFGVWEMQPLSWIIAIGMPGCFGLAMVMGANDVGNAFGTSVGSGVLSVRAACVVAAVFDFIGAVAMGQGVASTIRKGIVDVNMFVDVPELLMFGNLCSVIGAAMWVAIATVFKLPVSSTHAVIGSILGFALVQFGTAGVDWMGVAKIAISWIASPLLAGFIASVIFVTVRWFVLRRETDVALKRARLFISIVIGFVIFLASFFVVSEKVKGGMWAWLGPVLCAVGGVLIMLFLYLTPFGVDLIFKIFKPASVRQKEREEAKQTSAETRSAAGTIQMSLHDPVSATKAQLAEAGESAAEFLPEDLAELGAEDKPDSGLERFDETVETRFAAVQVLDAAYLSFCHGANDIANVAGPMASMWQIYETGHSAAEADTPFWVLIVMGAGIVVGLFFFGYRVIMTMGKSMTTVTPSRGFSMELGTATAVLVASYIKVPVSTTQAAVGSVVCVGLLGGEGRKAVNWKLFTGIIASWIITLPVAGGISALVYWALRPLVQAVYPHTVL